MNGFRRHARLRAVEALLLFAAVLLLVACGGDGASADETELERIRSEAELSNYNLLGTTETEALCRSALDIATRNAGQPIGDEAFALAEDLFLLGAGWGWFRNSVPAAPSEAQTPPDSFRAEAGFIEATPAPYRPARVLEKLHADFLNYADLHIRELEYARNNRLAWTEELQSQGTSERSWYGLLAVLDGGLTASMGANDAEDWRGPMQWCVTCESWQFAPGSQPTSWRTGTDSSRQ